MRYYYSRESREDAAVDHNLMRHLNSTRTAVLEDDFESYEIVRDQNEEDFKTTSGGGGWQPKKKV